MKCNDVENMIFSLAESVDLPEEKELQKHLEHCGACQELYRQLVATDAHIQQQKQKKPKADFASKVIAIHKEKKIQQEKSFRLSTFRFVASVAAAVLLGIVLGQSLSSFHYNETVLASSEISEEAYYLDDFQHEVAESQLLIPEE